MNTFDPATHTYQINGRNVPGVTSVLGDLIPGWRASEYYLGRGQAMHAYAAMIARNRDFEVADTDPDNRADMEGRVAALYQFFREVKPVVCEVEKQVFSARYQYAGTLDLLTRKPGALALMVADFKSGLGPSVPYQCAGYALAYEEEKGVPVNLGVGVEIRNDGTYRMSEVYDLRLYKQGWLAMLTTYGIRRQCGITEVQDE